MAISDTKTSAGAAASFKPSNRYRNLVLGLLMAAYTLSFLDRTIFNTISQAIKFE